MKKLFFLSFILLFTNCDRQLELIDRRFELINGTSRELKLDFYEKGGYVKSDFKKGEGLISSGRMDNDGGRGIAAFGAFNTDSVVATFDNEKKIIYTHITRIDRVNVNPAKRNILLDSAYVVINKELYRFTFTEEDYDNAELIEE